ncbi:MAG: site-specific DNA-methyltransferase [Bacteroidetes bacterium]|nr:site-specific DNA-methyltransferase [Bacteroidota bacterium]
MEYMKTVPDKYFDLAIVDPPYGINWDGGNDITKKGRPDSFDRKNNPKFNKKDWDASPPTKEYWDELFRVSKNQIVWGGNYFTNYLPVKKCWVFWDKLFDKTFNFSHGELAWTSWDIRMLKVVMSSKAETKGGFDKIHPTQKPIGLYRWLLKQFAKMGDKILDTHVGSGSSLIACKELGFDYVGCEIDQDYFEAAQKRINKSFRKYELFEGDKDTIR